MGWDGLFYECMAGCLLLIFRASLDDVIVHETNFCLVIGLTTLFLLVFDKLDQVHRRLVRSIPQITVLASVDIPDHKLDHLHQPLQLLVEVALHIDG